MKRLKLAVAGIAVTAALSAVPAIAVHGAQTTDDARDTTWSCPTCVTHR